MKFHTPTKILTLAVIAFGIVSLVFFDVIFLKASLQPSNISPQIGKPTGWESHSIYPQMNAGTTTVYGYADLGASLWQSEPAHYLMAHDFRQHESPWWNPYSAGGTVGPETLVDVKFSPFTLITAYFFNASAESFDYGLICIYVLGAFLMLLILNRQLGLSLPAASAGVVIYLLNGFALPNLNSHTGQVYFFFPLLLYSLFSFSEKQTTFRWALVAVAHAALLLITSLPTLILMLASTHLLNVAFCVQKNSGIHKSASAFTSISTKQGALIVAASIAGFFLVAFLWFPVIDSFSITDMLSRFQDRFAQKTFGFEDLLSIFTPKHFWQTSVPIAHSSLYPEANLQNTELLISYMGIFPALLASYALSKEILKTQKIVIAAVFLLLFSYARIFGLTGFIDHIPILSGIGIQYWGSVTALALIFLVSFGIENIRSGKITHIPALVVLVVVIAAFLKLYFTLGFVDLLPYHKYIKIVLYQIALGIVMILLLKKSVIDQRDFCIVMCFMMVFELIFYMNTLRPIRYNPIEKQPAFVSFLKNHIGDARVLNIGLTRSLCPEFGEMYGIRQVDTQIQGLLPWYRDFYIRHFGNDSWLFLTLGASAEEGKNLLPDKVISENALDIANVKYILVLDHAKPYWDFFQAKNYPIAFHKDGLTIFENTHAHSDATLLPSLIASDQIPETTDFHPDISAVTNDTTLIAQARTLGIPVLPAVDPSIKSLSTSTSTTVTAFHNTEITLETKSAQAAILALSEVWHPDWKATVDGQPVYVGRINEAFRGIALPSGQHQVRMYYDPASLRYGIRASLVTMLLLLMLFAHALRKQIVS